MPDDEDDGPFGGPVVVPIEEAIDLHFFRPAEVVDVVDAYLEAALEAGFREVRLIHGRGRGVQRNRIQRLLARDPRVERYADAPADRGGWGATIAWLRSPAPGDQDTTSPSADSREPRTSGRGILPRVEGELRNPGVVINARAGRASREPELVERLARLLPEGRVVATKSAEDLTDGLRALAASGVDLLVIIGGDGTVAGTLTALVEHWPGEELPAVSVLPGGTISTIPRSLGGTDDLEGAVGKLASGAKPSLDSRRPLVSVRTAVGSRHLGMIFTNGIGARWLELYYSSDKRGAAWAGRLVSRLALSALTGGELARRISAPLAAEVEVDGVKLPIDEFTVTAAGGVRHIGLGFQPFLTAGTEPDRFHFIATQSGLTRIAVEIPLFRMGVFRENSILDHHSAHRVVFRFPEPQVWSLDAELHPATRGLELTAEPTLRFVAA